MLSSDPICHVGLQKDVLLNKKHFDPIGGHGLAVYSTRPHRLRGVLHSETIYKYTVLKMATVPIKMLFSKDYRRYR